MARRPGLSSPLARAARAAPRAVCTHQTARRGDGPAPLQATSYIPGHNLSHHKYLQTRKDIMRTSKMKYRWQSLNLL